MNIIKLDFSKKLDSPNVSHRRGGQFGAVKENVM